jgi:hypothetical protein
VVNTGAPPLALPPSPFATRPPAVLLARPPLVEAIAPPVSSPSEGSIDVAVPPLLRLPSLEPSNKPSVPSPPQAT